MPLQHIWKEISKDEYDKNILQLEEKLSVDLFKKMFCFVPKDIVKREIIIPKHIKGIFEQTDYFFSNVSKEYKYYKSIGMEFYFLGSEEQCNQFRKLIKNGNINRQRKNY